MTTSEAAGARPPVYKRKMRNYLLDVGLQLRYTATIVVVAIFLTAGLGSRVSSPTAIGSSCGGSSGSGSCWCYRSARSAS